MNRRRLAIAFRRALRTRWGQVVALSVVAAVWLLVTLVTLRFSTSPVLIVVYVLVAVFFWRVGDETERPFAISALAFAASQPLLAGMRHLGNGELGLIGTAAGSFAILVGTATPALVAGDRWMRGRWPGYGSSLTRIPYLLPVLAGLLTVEGAAASVLWTQAVGNSDVAGFEIAIFGGAVATTVAAVREDRKRATLHAEAGFPTTAQSDADQRGDIGPRPVLDPLEAPEVDGRDGQA